MFRHGRPIQLPPLSYDFLHVLVENAPNLVTYSELTERVWGPRRTVTPENLKQRLLMLRQSLGDDALDPRYIELVRSQGCRLIPQVEPVPSTILSAASRGQRAGLLGLTTAGLLSLIGIFTWNPEVRVIETGTAAAEAVAASPYSENRVPDTIAVLRFEKLNDEPADARYFTEAMQAELINELGRSADLNVIARASMLGYGDGAVPIQTIADELRVSVIVAGSVRYRDDRVHVVAELLQADSGIQLWSGSYELSPSELFTAERDIAANIARALSVDLWSGSGSNPDMPTKSVEAFAFYMQAMDVFGTATPGSRATAQTYLDQAIALDADFAHAFAGKALIEAYTIINAGDAYEDSSVSSAEREQYVRDLAATALQLNPETDLAHYALGILDLFSWRWLDAHERFERAVALSPQHAVFLSQLGWLEVCGFDWQEGRRYSQRGVMLDPQNPYVHRLYGNVLECSGDIAGALVATETAVEVAPTSFADRITRAFRVARVEGDEAGLDALRKLEPLLTRERVLSLPPVALAYRELGHPEDARRLFDRFAAYADELRTGPANWYLAYRAISDNDNAYRMMQRAIERPGPGPGFYTLVAFMRNTGELPPFNEPRFLELRDRLRAKRQ